MIELRTHQTTCPRCGSSVTATEYERTARHEPDAEQLDGTILTSTVELAIYATADHACVPTAVPDSPAKAVE